MTYLQFYKTAPYLLASTVLLLVLSCSKQTDGRNTVTSSGGPVIPLVLIKKLSISQLAGDMPANISARPSNNDSDFDFLTKTNGEYLLRFENEVDNPFIRVESSNTAQTVFDIRATPGAVLRLEDAVSGDLLRRFKIDDPAIFRFTLKTASADTTAVKNALYGVLKSIDHFQYTSN